MQLNFRISECERYMNNYRTILMSLMKLGLGRLGAWIFVGKVPAMPEALRDRSFCNLEIYKKLFDNKLCYSTN